VRPLGGKWRPSIGNVGEWYVANRHLQGCSPRLCQLRTDELAPASMYWTYQSFAGVYGPSKPSSWSPTGAYLMPTASLVGLGEKLGTNSQIGQPVCYRLCQEPLFSGSVGSIQICRRLKKGCYMWTTWDMYGRLSVESMWHVGRVFPCWVYIDSNCYDSRVWVTAYLWQSSRR
jgi:hypothetical protein